MTNKLLFLLLNLCLRIGLAIGQQHIDTTLVIKHLKIGLYSEIPLGLISENALADYFNRKLNVIILESKGFDNIIFFKISSQVLAVDSDQEKNRTIIYSTPVCLNSDVNCCFVVAFNKNNNKFYKLKGTHENEFAELYNTLEVKWRFWREIKKINASTINHFLKDYWIDEIDLKCLLGSLINKKGACLDYFAPNLKVN